MSKNVQQGLEDVWEGRPTFDDPHQYTFIHETIRDHTHRKPERRMVALCFECMENPKREPRNDDERPVRCDECEYKHQRRMKAAARADARSHGTLE